MDQGVLETLKRLYKQKFLEELILRDEEGVSIPEFLKSINMLTVSNVIAASWDEISCETIRLSWRKIIPTTERESTFHTIQTTEGSSTVASSSSSEPTSADMEEFQTLFNHIGQEK